MVALLTKQQQPSKAAYSVKLSDQDRSHDGQQKPYLEDATLLEICQDCRGGRHNAAVAKCAALVLVGLLHSHSIRCHEKHTQDSAAPAAGIYMCNACNISYRYRPDGCCEETQVLRWSHIGEKTGVRATQVMKARGKHSSQLC